REDARGRQQIPVRVDECVPLFVNEHPVDRIAKYSRRAVAGEDGLGHVCEGRCGEVSEEIQRSFRVAAGSTRRADPMHASTGFRDRPLVLDRDGAARGGRTTGEDGDAQIWIWRGFLR